ncbi:hypothetical protein JB92DRAFT_2842458, partial [Gautieria morchelliformis]
MLRLRRAACAKMQFCPGGKAGQSDGICSGISDAEALELTDTNHVENDTGDSLDGEGDANSILRSRNPSTTSWML